jgi:hypothetical protein
MIDFVVDLMTASAVGCAMISATIWVAFDEYPERHRPPERNEEE